MTAEIPSTTPEKKEILDDNALKFTTKSISPEFLRQHEAVSFLLRTDWLEMNESNEKKLAYKQFKDGSIEMLLIQKFTDENGKRTVPPKEKLSHEQYDQLLGQSIRRVEKLRFEFNYLQDDTVFAMKYDEFIDSKLRVLEVDAESEIARESFRPNEFSSELTNVTGEIKYYGYRVAEVL